MECLRSMRHMIYLFFFEILALTFSITILKMFQVGSPWESWGRGVVSFFCLFDSQNLIPEHLQFLLVTEAELCIDLDH